MASRFQRPESLRIDLTDGDWILVKKRLSAGESRRLMSRMVKEMRAGERVQLEPEQVGRSKIIEYLLDWSFIDGTGPVVIRGKSATEIGQILDGLNQESFTEVMQAIDAHEDAMDAERSAEKNVTAGETPSSATSILPA